MSQELSEEAKFRQLRGLARELKALDSLLKNKKLNYGGVELTLTTEQIANLQAKRVALKSQISTLYGELVPE